MNISEASEMMKNSYVAGKGKIDPWGTIYILDLEVPDPGRDPLKPFCLRPGLAVWSEKLLQYGKDPKYRADMNSSSISVKEGRVTKEKISFVEFSGHVKDMEQPRGILLCNQKGFLTNS
ncbi:MAG: hypothetical protein KGJ13_02005 [Patescibacteria group bacterium]|nr:hypothetical protein [Patescibacteria group bacterium]